MDQQSSDILVSLVLDIKKDVADIKEKTAANTVTLDDHSRRSTASEGRLNVQEEKLEKFIEKMEPIQDHVKAVENIAKFSVSAIKILAVVVSVIATVMGIIHHLH